MLGCSITSHIKAQALASMFLLQLLLVIILVIIIQIQFALIVMHQALLCQLFTFLLKVRVKIIVNFILKLGGVSIGCLDLFSLDVIFIEVINLFPSHGVLSTLFQTILHIDFLSIHSSLHNTKGVHSNIIVRRLKSHIKDALDITQLDFMFPL